LPFSTTHAGPDLREHRHHNNELKPKLLQQSAIKSEGSGWLNKKKGRATRNLRQWCAQLNLTRANRRLAKQKKGGQMRVPPGALQNNQHEPAE
jgi:hypothetical protein